MSKIREIWKLLKSTVSEWQFNQVSLLASSLAYFTVFSLAPLMILIMMMVGAIFGEAEVKDQLVAQMEEVVGSDGAQAIATAITNMRGDAAGGTFSVVFNIGFFAVGASGVFSQIQNALDRIWEVKPEPGRNIFNFVRKRLLSFAMVLVIAFLLIVSFIANTVLATLVVYLSGLVPGLGQLWQILSLLLSLAIISLLFASMFAILPDAKVVWQDAAIGGFITALLFMFGQFLFGQFLSRTDFGSAYGVAGSFLIVITWIYFAAHILFFGAEFTKVYAERHGTPIEPEEYAVHIDHDPDAENQQEEKIKQKNRDRSRQRGRNTRNMLNRMRPSRNRFLQRLTGNRSRRNRRR